MDRVNCIRDGCTRTVLPSTAKKTGGICMPCKKQDERTARLEANPHPEENFVDPVYDQIEAEVAAHITTRQIVRYSAYPVDSNNKAVNNLNEVAAEGAIIFVNESCQTWGNGKRYHSKVLINPTWLDVARMANDMLITTEDTHHVFLENIRFVTETGSTKLYELEMGS